MELTENEKIEVKIIGSELKEILQNRSSKNKDQLLVKKFLSLSDFIEINTKEKISEDLSLLLDLDPNQKEEIFSTLISFDHASLMEYFPE
jgi:hypothetical protein